MNIKKRKRRRRVYANRNRAWNTRQNALSIPTRSAAVIVVAVAMGVFWLGLSHAVDSVYDDIKAEEGRRDALLEDLNRETVKWNNSKTPARVVTALARHGLRMERPRRAQYVAVRQFRPGGGAVQSPSALASNR